MTKILDIKATTTDEAIELAIPFLDMRQEATERRDDARAVLDEQGDQTVLEVHNIDGVTVLYSPAFAYALVNERSPGVGNSLLIGAGECRSPEHAAQAWVGEGKERVMTGIDVSDEGVSRFNAWFANVAKPGVSLHAVALEALNHFEDAASTGQDYIYELAGEFTASGRPEVFTLAREWVTVHHEWQ